MFRPVQTQVIAKKKKESVDYKQLLALGAIGAVSTVYINTEGVLAVELDKEVEAQPEEEVNEAPVEVVVENEPEKEPESEAVVDSDTTKVEPEDDKVEPVTDKEAPLDTKEEPESEAVVDSDTTKVEPEDDKVEPEDDKVEPVTDKEAPLDTKEESEKDKDKVGNDEETTEDVEKPVKDETVTDKDKPVTDKDKIDKEKETTENVENTDKEGSKEPSTETKDTTQKVEKDESSKEEGVLDEQPTVEEYPDDYFWSDDVPEQPAPPAPPVSRTGNEHLDNLVKGLPTWEEYVASNPKYGQYSGIDVQATHIKGETVGHTELTDAEEQKLLNHNVLLQHDKVFRDETGNAYYITEYLPYSFETQLGSIMSWTDFGGMTGENFKITLDSDDISATNAVKMEIPLNMEQEFAFVLELFDGTKIFLDHEVDYRNMAVFNLKTEGVIHVLSNVSPVLPDDNPMDT